MDARNQFGLTKLPPDILLEIFFLLPVEFLALNMAVVSRFFKALIASPESDSLWRNNLHYHFPDLLGQKLPTPCNYKVFNRVYNNKHYNVPTEARRIYAHIKDTLSLEGFETLSLTNMLPLVEWVKQKGFNDVLCPAYKIASTKYSNPYSVSGAFAYARYWFTGDSASYTDNTIDVLKQENGGMTLLHLAIQFGQSDTIIENLISRGADVNARRRNYKNGSSTMDVTPLAEAVLAKRPATIKRLLAHPNVSDNTINQPLEWAIRENYPEGVRILLADQRVGLSCELSVPLKPLSLAASGGCHEIVKIFLDDKRMTDEIINDTSETGSHTALLSAVLERHTKVVEVLLADPRTDVNRSNPLVSAIGYGQDIEILKALLAHPNIDVNQPSSWGRTPLEEAHHLSLTTRLDMTDTINALLAHPKIIDNRRDASPNTSSLLPFSFVCNRTRVTEKDCRLEEFSDFIKRSNSK